MSLWWFLWLPLNLLQVLQFCTQRTLLWFSMSMNGTISPVNVQGRTRQQFSFGPMATEGLCTRIWRRTKELILLPRLAVFALMLNWLKTGIIFMCLRSSIWQRFGELILGSWQKLLLASYRQHGRIRVLRREAGLTQKPASDNIYIEDKKFCPFDHGYFFTKINR